MRREDKISLSHGNGSRLMQELTADFFLKNFCNKKLDDQSDSAIHGMAEMNALESFNFKTPDESDLACLYQLNHEVLDNTGSIKFMRDAIRGCVATVIDELTAKIPYRINIDHAP